MVAVAFPSDNAKPVIPEFQQSAAGQPRLAIIGGGIAGLSAAFRLQRLGARVVVYEAENRVGGRAFTDELDGYRIDAGAQLIGSMYGHFLELVHQLGLSASLVKVPGRDALWRDGRAHEVVLGSVASMVASGGLPMTTKMRLGATYVPFLTRHAAALQLLAPEHAAVAGLDRETIAQWGEREIDRTFVRSLVYPQLGAYYGALPGETSAAFYHILAKYGMDVKLFALAGGIGLVAEGLKRGIMEAGGEVRCGSVVGSIAVGAQSIGVTIEAGAGEESYDGAIAAIPAPLLAGMLQGAPAALVEWLAAVRYRPTLSVAILLDQPAPARYFGLSFPEGDSRFLSALCVQENKHSSLVPAGKGLLLLLPTPETAPALVGMDSKDVIAKMLPEVARVFPGLDRHITRARVYRWPTGAPIFFPGYPAHLGAFRATNLESGTALAIAGDFLHTPSVEGSAASGVRAAERLFARFGGIGT